MNSTLFNFKINDSWFTLQAHHIIGISVNSNSDTLYIWTTNDDEAWQFNGTNPGDTLKLAANFRVKWAAALSGKFTLEQLDNLEGILEI